MSIFFIAMSIILGFIMGSFLNVISLRYGTGKSLGGRSMCMSCGKTLSWYELIPVVSWLIQRGRCRSCSSKIPFELLGSELLAGIFFGLIAMRGLFTHSFVLNESYFVGTGYLFFIFSLLLIIFFYDIRHKIIPDKLSFIFALGSFISMFFFSIDNTIFFYQGFHLPSFWHVLAGIFVPLPFVLIWAFSKGKLMGLGDPKLMVGIGFLLGLSKGFTAIIISFWIGAIFVFALMVVEKILHKKLLRNGQKSIMKAEIPFAPFLILGTLITVIFNYNIFFIQ